jgi:hypothetical protein
MVYLTDTDNASWYFPDTSNVVMGPNEFVKTSVQTVSEGQSIPDTSNVVMGPNEFVKTSVQTVSEGQSISMLNSHSVKEGKVTLDFEANEFTTTLELIYNYSRTRYCSFKTCKS